MRLPGLDILRGIAAFAVLIYHCEGIYEVRLGFSHGYLSVDFFFCLSGYVMARTYEHRFAGTLDFTISRYKRFAPVMAIGAAIGFVYLVGNHPIWFAVLAAVCAVFFIPTPGGGTPFPANPPTWSIQVELLCNLLHALILRRLHWVGLVAISAGLSAWLIGLDLGPDGGTQVKYALIRGLISYCIGITLFRFDHILPKLPFAIAPLILVVAATTSGWEWHFVLIGFPLAIIAGRSTSISLDPLGAISFPLYAIHEPIVRLGKMHDLPVIVPVVVSIVLALAITYHAKLAAVMARRHSPRSQR